MAGRGTDIKLGGNKDFVYDGKKEDEKEITDCCGQDKEHHVLNSNNKDEWELIERHIERHLRDYPNTESITPVVCEECGRLIEYISNLKLDRKLPGDK